MKTVNTPHGKATILGFERFDKDGNTAPMSQTYRGDERIICKLHEGHTAHSYYDNNDYAMYSHEYKNLNAALCPSSSSNKSDSAI